MKKLLILFLCFMLALSASAQISIKHNGTLRDLFTTLQTQYGYNFMYSNNDINDQQVVVLNVVNAGIETVFNQITRIVNISYAVKSKQIAIKKAEPRAIASRAEIKTETKRIEPKAIELVEKKTPIEINAEKIEQEVEPVKAEAPLSVEGKDVVVTSNNTEIYPKKDAEPKQQTAPKTKNINKKSAEKISPWKFSLTTNLLYDLAATLNAGVELKYTERYGLAVNGGWMHLNWGDQKRYRIWFFNPELRCYLSPDKRYYLGGELHVGELNFQFSDTGNQGNFAGGGLTLGYIISMNSKLQLDLGIGLGYTRYKYDTYYYNSDSDKNIRKESGIKNLWLPKPGVTLVWVIK